jgi:hypothetical protein
MAVPKTAALPLGYTPTTAFYLKTPTSYEFHRIKIKPMRDFLKIFVF